MRTGEFTKFLDVFAPQICLSCGAAGGIFCASCTHSLSRVQAVRGEVNLGFTKVPGFAGGIYSETIRDCLVGVKRTGSSKLYRLLVPIVAEAVSHAIESVDQRRPLAFVPISSGAKTKRSFGGDFVQSLLSDSLQLLSGQDRITSSVKIGIHDHLTSRRIKRSQKWQSSRGRYSNIHGAFRADTGSVECLRTTHIVFDDILTTGSTAREAARALDQAGINVKAVVAAAARPRALSGLATR